MTSHERKTKPAWPFWLPGAVLTILFVRAALAAGSIGLVMPVCCELGDQSKDKFASYLQQSGVAPGQAEIILQRPGLDKISILNSIRKVLAYDAGMLIVFGGAAAKEAARETKSVPVIFIGVYDPVRQGLVANPERPGGNMTGVSSQTSLPFLLDRIQETIPLQNLGVIHHSDNADSISQVAELKDLAAKRNIRLTMVDMKAGKVEDLAGRFQGVQFVYLAAGCFDYFITQEDLLKIGRPVAAQCQNIEGTESVFTLSADNDTLLLDASRIAARLLKGEKASQVPVAGAKKIDFIINLPVAERLGLKIPFPVLSRATRIIK